MRTIISLAFLSLTAARLEAQCTPAWAPFGAMPGVNNVVNAIANWDPDGPGPLSPRVVVGGLFGLAGSVQATGVASWDPVTTQWSALGTGPTGRTWVTALLALPNGDLIAGTSYTLGEAPTQTLTLWNGTSWTPFGGATAWNQGWSAPGVTALARLPNGDIAVGGHFSTAGATALGFLGVWNGTSWSTLCGGMDGPVLDLAVMPNGDLVAVGAFTIAGGVPANGVARWNGTAWFALGAGLTGNVSTLPPQGDAAIVLPNGDLVVGGRFAQAGGVTAVNVARWNGLAWSAVGGGITGSNFNLLEVLGLAVLPNGDLVVGGGFAAAGGSPIANIARWNGTAWSSFGTGIPDGRVNDVAVSSSGDLVAGGTFSVAGGVGATSVARWDGTAWSSLGRGAAPSDDVRSLITMPDGSVVAGGLFRAAGDVVANGVARWNGSQWSGLGSGFPPSGAVNAMALRPNGDLVAAGNGLIGSWNGTAWTHLPATMTGGVPRADGAEAVAVLANGNIVVGGDFSSINSLPISGLAHWDGTTWSMLGGQMAGEVHAMVTLDTGDLIVGGEPWFLPGSTNGLSRWNGSTWSAVGLGLGNSGSSATVYALAPLPGGGFVAGGQFAQAGGAPANNIARWNGTTWFALGSGTNGPVRSAYVLPNGDILAAGNFTQAGGIAAAGAARWDGTTWSAIGNGQQPPSHPGVLAFAMASNGDLLVGGGFDRMGDQTSPNLVRLVTPCLATAQPFGSGCVSSGGLVDLAAITRPWLGATFRSRATGLPATAVAAIAYGFQSASITLSAVVAPAGAGCRLWQTLDQWSLALPTAGALDTTLPIPDAPALIGLVLHQQVGSAELQGATVLEWTSSNRLTLVLGRF